MLLSRNYHFEFPHPVDKLWAVVSDTARWGEATGFPKYQARETLQDDGRVTITGHAEIAGIKINWEEPPVNWISNHWFEQSRITNKGPIAEMTTVATLDDLKSSSKLEIELRFNTRNWLGSLIARRLLGVYHEKINRLLSDADRLISAEEPGLFVSRYQPSQTSLKRTARLARQISETPYDHGLVQKLIDYINQKQEVDLWSIRPLAIASSWQVPGRLVVELFLQSVRSGLLESRWDILCPRCRVSNSQISNMSDLPKGVHCDACNIDFDSEFARNVELSFSPSPAIRSVEYGFYCRSGPGTTPHVKGQCSLEADSSRSLPLLLDAGDYRLRTLEAGGEIALTWNGGSFPEILLHQGNIELGGDSPQGQIKMTNRGSVHRTIVIEEQSWLRDVLTAEKVMTMQAFRDLFSDQVLRPGDEVSIRNISFMFSDLVGSSEMFGRLGDAEAYHLVREHFAVLSAIVRKHDGSIVKTIGDGIHAAYLTPDSALAAAIEMQHAMPEFNRRLGHNEVSIRVGLHLGSSIAVTLNDRLDYYGEVVNLSARLEGQGEAGDITMSQAFSEDPAVAEILQDYKLNARETSVKGFSDPVAIVQIKALGQA